MTYPLEDEWNERTDKREIQPPLFYALKRAIVKTLGHAIVSEYGNGIDGKLFQQYHAIIDGSDYMITIHPLILPSKK